MQVARGRDFSGPYAVAVHNLIRLPKLPARRPLPAADCPLPIDGPALAANIPDRMMWDGM